MLNSEFLVDAPWLKVAKETCELPSGYITVQNAQGLNITVFNSLGNVVRSTKGIGCEQKVYTGAKGMYVVKIGNQAKIINIK